MKRFVVAGVVAVIVLMWASAHVFASDCFSQVRTYSPAIAWSPPAQVVADGSATYNYRQSEEWQQNRDEINQLRGALQVYASLGLTPPAGMQQQTEAAKPAEPMRPGQGPLPAPEANPPAAPNPAANGKYPLLMAKCANCHGTPNPSGDFFINPQESFEGDDNAWKVVKILKKAYRGEMPVDKDGNPHPLTDEEYAELEHEFLAAP